VDYATFASDPKGAALPSFFTTQSGNVDISAFKPAEVVSLTDLETKLRVSGPSKPQKQQKQQKQQTAAKIPTAAEAFNPLPVSTPSDLVHDQNSHT